MLFYERKWQLFFVYRYSLNHFNEICGAFFHGRKILESDIKSIDLNELSNGFVWVNVCSHILSPFDFPCCRFPVKQSGGCFYGASSPTVIQFPNMSYSSKINQDLSQLKFGVPDNGLHGFSTNNCPDNSCAKADCSIPVHKRAIGNRLHRVFHTEHKLTEPFLTILMSRKHNLMYDTFKESEEKLIVVPYIWSTIRLEHHPFCLVKLALLQVNLINELHGLRREEYNKFLEDHCTQSFWLFKVKEQQPVRFLLLEEKEFDTLFSNDNPCLYEWTELRKKQMDSRRPYNFLQKLEYQSNCLLYCETDLPNIVIPGICVSMWHSSTQLRPVSATFNSLVQDSFGRGYGDRKRCSVVGSNIYLGCHYKKRVLPRPETPPNTRDLDHFSRQDVKYIQRVPLINKEIYSLAKKTLMSCQSVNDNFMRYFGYSTCDQLIWTQGLEGECNVGQKATYSTARSLGFCNELHIDLCDKIPSCLSERWISDLSKTKYNGENRKRNEQARDFCVSKFQYLRRSLWNRPSNNMCI